MTETTGAGIPEAVLRLPRLGLFTTSDATGWCRLEAVEPGPHEASLAAPGYLARTMRLEIPVDQPFHRREFFLTPDLVELDAFAVEATLSEEDKTVREAREAVTPTMILSGDALQDAANEDIGEVLESVAGVSVEGSEGNVTGVKIRGASARQTRISIDGQSMAGGGGRGTTRGAAAMSQVPREFLQRIQITKASTPDMDADAIGGSIDMQTSRVARTNASRTSLSLRHGYLDPYGDWSHHANVAHARPFSLGEKDRRLGILLSFNVEKAASAGADYRVLNQWPERPVPDSEARERFLARFPQRLQHHLPGGLRIAPQHRSAMGETASLLLQGAFCGTGPNLPAPQPDV